VGHDKETHEQRREVYIPQARSSSSSQLPAPRTQQWWKSHAPAPLSRAHSQRQLEVGTACLAGKDGTKRAH
jgi:hypothetical protein